MTRDEVLRSMAAAIDDFPPVPGYRVVVVLIEPSDPSNMLVVGNVDEAILRRGFDLLAVDDSKGRGLVNRDSYTELKKDME